MCLCCDIVSLWQTVTSVRLILPSGPLTHTHVELIRNNLIVCPLGSEVADSGGSYLEQIRQLSWGRRAVLQSSNSLPAFEGEIKKVVNQKVISIQVCAQSSRYPAHNRHLSRRREANYKFLPLLLVVLKSQGCVDSYRPNEFSDPKTRGKKTKKKKTVYLPPTAQFPKQHKDCCLWGNIYSTSIYCCVFLLIKLTETLTLVFIVGLLLNFSQLQKQYCKTKALSICVCGRSLPL